MALEVPKSNLKSINLVLNRDFKYMETTPRYKKYTSEEVYDKALKFAEKLLNFNWSAREYFITRDGFTETVDKRIPELGISWEAPITRKFYYLRIALYTKFSIEVILYKTKEIFEKRLNSLNNSNKVYNLTDIDYLHSDGKILEVKTSNIIDNDKDFVQVFKNVWYICWEKEVKLALQEATERLKEDLPVYFSVELEKYCARLY